MASWMVHLRIADHLLDQIPGLSPQDFIVGNVAPDSGVPNADWSVFTPSTAISHFRTPRHKKADPLFFAEKYFTKDQIPHYNPEEFSFYLGYLVHLITDVAWSENIYYPAKTRFAQEMELDPNGFVWKLKDDWYDQDFLYLRDHPNFRAFQIYLSAVGFKNHFMEEFSVDAFENRRQYITGFYLAGKENLDRDYPYLTKDEMDMFVESTTQKILCDLSETYLPQHL